MKKTILDLTDDQYKTLKKAYIQAGSKQIDKFVVFQQECLTQFAKYWLEAVEDRRMRQRRKLYSVDSKGYWHWKEVRK
jgi:hypothetical protein